MKPFSDRLSTKLTLTVAGTGHEIIADRIDAFSLSMRPYGFEGELSFSVECVSDPSEDEVFADFVKPDLADIALVLERSLAEPDEEPTSITLKALVTERWVAETAFADVAGQPVLIRRYRVRFADRAAVLWGEHRPTALYVDATYEDLFSDNLPDGVTLSHSWAASSTTHPVLSLGLGADENEASFLDYVFWQLDRQGAGLVYDASADSYSIADTKTSGDSVTVEREEIGGLEVVFPRLRRAKPVVLNGATEAAEKKKEGTNDQGVDGVRDDFLVRTPVASEHDARSTLEGTRAQQRRAGAKLWLTRFPSAPIVPGAALALSSELSTNLFVNGKSFRVTTVELTARNLGEVAGTDVGASSRFEMTYAIEVEQASDPVFHAPSFIAPRYPFEVEGKVVSETGADDEETYQIYQDSTTSRDQYKVSVPLFDDKKVVVKFEPTSLSGHFYFPAYKGERVLIALFVEHADMVGFLDWRPGARLPLDSQGNHILFGKKAASQTSMQHVYEDAKPVLAIKRTADKDEQTIKILDGTIRMETKEND